MGNILTKTIPNTKEKSPTGMDNLKRFIKDTTQLALKYKKFSFLIPAILGGTYQTIGLLQVGITYIQYFSVTQLVADSIMYSLFLVLFFAILLVCILYTDGATNWLNNRIKKRPKRIHLYKMQIAVFTWVISWSILLAIIVVQSDAMPTKHEWLWILFFVLVFPILFVAPFYGLQLLYFKYATKLIDRLTPKRAASQSEIKVILGGFCLVSYLILTVGAYGFLHKPNGLENLKYLECQLEKEYPKHSKIYIYANDKFVFYKLIDNSLNVNFKILKFDDLFITKICE